MLDWGLRLTLLLALPAALGLILARRVATLFPSAFDDHDVTMTSWALTAQQGWWG